MENTTLKRHVKQNCKDSRKKKCVDKKKRVGKKKHVDNKRRSIIIGNSNNENVGNLISVVSK